MDDSESIDDALERDLRTEDQRRYDALADEVIASTSAVNRLIAHLERNPPGQGQTQTVIHRNEGMGAWGAAAVVACFATWIFLLAILLYVVPYLHDLDAWRSVHSNDIAALKAQLREKGK